MSGLIIWILIIVYILSKHTVKNQNTNNIFESKNKLISVQQNVVINTADAKYATLKVNCSFYLNNPQKYLEMNSTLKNSLVKTVTKFYSGKNLNEVKKVDVDELKLKNDLLDRLQEYKQYVTIGIIKIEYLGTSLNATTSSDSKSSSGLNNKKSIFESSVEFGDYKNDYSNVECIHKDEQQKNIKSKTKYNIFGFEEDYLDNPIKENISERKYFINDEEDDDPIKNL